MHKLAWMTFGAACLFAAPAFAQEDEEQPDANRLMERAQQLVERVQELVEPLLEKVEETVRQIMDEIHAWMEEMDPGEMFGEYDMEQWMEELRRMFENMPGAPGFEEDEEDEEFILAPSPLPVC
ncbi:MAG: hypothetical protein HYY16_16480 [Planctomycetes bacterium]|nr:hypothetical protein [Planctomycetota bacterium]